MEINQFNFTSFNNDMKSINETIQKSSLNQDKTLTQKTIDSLFVSDSSKEINNFNDSVGYIQMSNGALKNIQNKLDQIDKLQKLSDSMPNSGDEPNVFDTQIDKLSQNINDLLKSTYNGQSLFTKSDLNGVKLDTELPKFDKNNIDEFKDKLSNSQNNVLDAMKQINNQIDTSSSKIYEQILDKNEITSSHDTDYLQKYSEDLLYVS